MTLRQESGRSDGRMEDEEEIAPLLYPIQNLPPLTLVSRRFRLLWSTSADNPANSGAQRLGRQRRSVKDQGGWRYGRELQEFWRVKHAALELFGSGARIRMWVFNLKELNPLLDDTTCETREDDTLMHYKSQTMGIGGFEVEAGMILQSNDLSRMALRMLCRFGQEHPLGSTLFAIANLLPSNPGAMTPIPLSTRIMPMPHVLFPDPHVLHSS